MLQDISVNQLINLKLLLLNQQLLLQFGKKLKGSIYYRFQREVNYSNVQTQNILGVNLSYNLGKRKNKKAEPQIIVE